MTCLETLPPTTLRERLFAVLETQRLVLRAPQFEDAKAVAAIANDRRVAENTARIPHPYRMSDAETWIVGSAAELDAETYLITLANGTVIGGCGFDMRDGPVPEIGYWLGTKWHPGHNVGVGKDHTLFAKINGRVAFNTKAKGRTYVSVLPMTEAAAE